MLFRRSEGNRMFGVSAFAVAVALVSGEATAFAFPLYSSAWPWMASLLVFAAVAKFGWNIRYGGLVMVFALGAVLASRTDAMLSSVVSTDTRPANAPFTFDLFVAKDAECLSRNGKVVARFLSDYGVLKLLVAVSVDSENTAPRAGEVWRCMGWLSQPKKGRNRFSRRRFWAARPGASFMIKPVDQHSAFSKFRALGDSLAAKAGLGLSSKPETVALNRAILLGRRADIPFELNQIFVDAGTVHVFAISGLHVMLVAGVLAFLIRRLGVPYELRGFLTIPLIVGYTILVGAPASAVRAALMAILFFAAPLFGRRSDSLASWSVTAIIVYGLFPENFFNAGCALSFIVMFGIVLWCRSAAQMPPQNGDVSRAIHMADLNGNKRYAFFLRAMVKVRSAVFGAVAISVAAWIAGVPVMAHVFGRFTISGLFANLIVIPLVTAVVFLGIAGIAIGAVSESVASIFNGAAGICTDCMVHVSRLAAAVPGGHFDVHYWTVAECLAWYGTVILSIWLVSRFFARNKHGLSWVPHSA